MAKYARNDFLDYEPGNIDRVRFLMTLRAAGIHDMRVMAAMERVPRSLFTPALLRYRAWENRTIPIGGGQTLSQPEVVARMTQALELDRAHKVLEIGTGSGYQTAILALLSDHVYSIERSETLLGTAVRRLSSLGIGGVNLRHGDGTMGWPEQAGFDRILLTAAVEDIPPILWDQLAMGGMMVLPIGDEDDQRVMRYRRSHCGVEETLVTHARFVPMLAGMR